MPTVTHQANAEADAARAALADMDAKREAFKTRVRHVTLRSTVLMQWKLAIGLVRAQRVHREAASAIGEARALRKQVQPMRNSA